MYMFCAIRCFLEIQLNKKRDTYEHNIAHLTSIIITIKYLMIAYL